VETAARDAVVARLADHRRLLEVGIGRRVDVAAALAAAGHDVLAVDVEVDPARQAGLPGTVALRRADVTAVDPVGVAPRDAVYALNLPPELHRPSADLAAALGAPLLFTTLGFDGPARGVPAVAESLPEGETLYVVRPPRAGGSNGDGGAR